MGSTLPYLSVFLDERGLSMSQIGWVLSLTGVAVMVSPVLTAFLADTRVQSRTLLGVLFGLSAFTLAGLAEASGFWSVLIVHGAFALAFVPVNSLQDGLYFQRHDELERQRRLTGVGRETQPYHVVRVFGTLGFIVPSLLLYFLLRSGVDTVASVWCGAACAGLGLLNALTLPRTPRPGSRELPGEIATEAAGQACPEGFREEAAEALAEDGRNDPSPAAAQRRKRLPTAEAARAMLEPHVLVFCVAMLLLHMAITAYYSFYPVYLTRRVGVGAEWVGLISNLGVVIEIGFMLGFGWLMRSLGLKKLMVIGAASMAVRFALLGYFPGVGVAVGTQVFHGIMVLIMHVAPPIYLNHRAAEGCRNSIQGLYAMVVYGIGRIAGSLIAGWIADVSLTAVFLYAAVLALAATGLFAFAFADGVVDDVAAEGGGGEPRNHEGHEGNEGGRGRFLANGNAEA